jgi:DNA-binding phage protein
MYDLTSMHGEPAMLQFFRKLSQNADLKNNEVYFAFGSFGGIITKLEKKSLIAKKSRVTQQQLSKIENGYNCNLLTFIKVSSTLGLSVNLSA